MIRCILLRKSGLWPRLRGLNVIGYSNGCWRSRAYRRHGSLKMAIFVQLMANLKSQDAQHPCLKHKVGASIEKASYSECLTPAGSYVVYCKLDPLRNLAPSTEAQGVLQDHGRSTISKDSLPTGSRQWSWEKPASGGFFWSAIKSAITGRRRPVR